MSKYQGKKTFIISGNTYNYKDKIKKAGGHFNSNDKTWIVELFSSDSLWAYEGRITFTEDKQEKSSFGYEQDHCSDTGERFYS